MTETEPQTEWWSTGYDEMDSLPQGSVGDRLYMKVDEERTLLFLDGSPDDKELFGRPYGAPFCFPAGTPVMLRDGVKAIEDVREGDVVLRADGTFGKVTHSLRRPYTGQMAQLSLKKYTDPLVATENHKIRVVEATQCVRAYRSTKYKKWCSPACSESCSTRLHVDYRVVEKEIGKIDEGDYVMIPGSKPWAPSAEQETPTITGPHGEVMPLTTQMAWMLGLYAAEGHNKCGPHWTLHEKETELADAVTDICVEAFTGLIPDTLTVSAYANPRSKAVQHAVNGKSLGDWFETSCGKHAANKKLPPEIVYGPPQIRSAAVEGLVDGDGNILTKDDGTDRVTYVTVSRHLAYQLQTMLLGFGLRPGIYTREAWVDDAGTSRQKTYNVVWARKNKYSHGMMFQNGIGDIEAPVYAVRAKKVELFEVEDEVVYNLTIEDDGKSRDPHSYTAAGVGVSNCINEYQIPTKGPEDEKVNWRNWATCVRGRKNAEGLPMRDFVKEGAPDLRPYYVGMYTAVDVSEVDLEKLVESGKPLPDSCRKYLVPAKRKQLGKLKKHSERRGGLRGCYYDVYRSDKRSASTGDDWQHGGKLTDAQIQKLLPDGAHAPFEYAKVLEPLPEGEIQGLLNIRTKVTKFGNDKDSGNRGRDRDSGRSRRRRGRDQDNQQDEVNF